MDYAEIAESAEEMIREYGAPCRLRRAVDLEYDVETGIVEGTERIWNGLAVRIEFELRDIDGSEILLTDFRLLAAVGGFERPKTGDRVTFDDQVLQVIGCKPIKPATVALVYDIQVRK